jgi:hypothetical protein
LYDDGKEGIVMVEEWRGYTAGCQNNDNRDEVTNNKVTDIQNEREREGERIERRELICW